MTKKLTIKGGPTSNSIKLLWGDVELNEFVEKIEIGPILPNQHIRAKLTVYVDQLELEANADTPVVRFLQSFESEPQPIRKSWWRRYLDWLRRVW